MQYFAHLTPTKINKYFHCPPSIITRNSEKNILAAALGASLYMPAIRESIVEDIISCKYKELSSVIICLEDSINDKDVLYAENKICNDIEELYRYYSSKKESEIPFIFLRIRSVAQMRRISKKVQEKIEIILGFVLPKFSTSNAQSYLDEIIKINKLYEKNLYIMPILESKEIIYKEKREESLHTLYLLIKKYQDIILNIRIGATDFSSLFSVRRGLGQNIYNIDIIRDCLIDIINTFSRSEDDFVISGCVYEYFNDQKGLIKETKRDRLNGIIGKTVIHPKQIYPVQTCYTVSFEEYMDAKNILDEQDKGVINSISKNKMNEIKPHHNWALRILLLSSIYGVLKQEYTGEDLVTYTQCS